MDLTILGDETPEAIVFRGEPCPTDVQDVVLFWDEESKSLLESSKFTMATLWTATRVLLHRYGTWVCLDRDPRV